MIEVFHLKKIFQTKCIYLMEEEVCQMVICKD